MKIATVCRLVTVFALFLLFLGTGEVSCAPVETSLNLNHPTVLRGQSQSIYALLEFRVEDILPENKGDREPLDLSLVIDRSGSMNQRGKLIYAQTAAREIVNMLSPRDTLSIVEYNNSVGVAWPQGPVVRKDSVKRIIDSLTPRGSTNLSGGMTEGVRQIAEFGRGKAVRRVVLLSDGLANQGETDPRRIFDLASMARGRGVNITTMGLGLDYDEDLMQGIAEAGGGKYYYIENPNQVAEIFEQEMNILFNTVTGDVSLDIVPSEHVKKVEVLGYPIHVVGNRHLVSMSDFYAGESRSLLIRLDIDGLNATKVSLGKIELQYNDLVGCGHKTESLEIVVNTSVDAALVERLENRNVSVESILVSADQEHEDFVRLYEQGRVGDAKNRLDELSTKLERDFIRHKDVKIAKKLEALKMEAREMDRSESDMAYRKNYLKKNKQAFYLSKKGNRGKYMLMEGTNGHEVLRLQEALAKRDYYHGPRDGIFTKETAEALTRYQRANNLEPDGVAGPLTLRGLGLY